MAQRNIQSLDGLSGQKSVINKNGTIYSESQEILLRPTKISDLEIEFLLPGFIVQITFISVPIHSSIMEKMFLIPARRSTLSSTKNLNGSTLISSIP